MSNLKPVLNVDVNIVGTGKTGASAYDEWLNKGNIGTAADFLESLKGEVTDLELQAVKDDLAEHKLEKSLTPPNVSIYWLDTSHE